jgi:hypothetical protein
MNVTDNRSNLPDNLLNEREELVVRLRDEEKLTFREIGARLGKTSERVRQIHVKARVKLKDFAENGEDALSLLPMRACRLVVNLKIGCRASARAAMESGRLSWQDGICGIFWDGDMLRQMNRKTWVALYEWAGCPTMPAQTGSNQEFKDLDGHDARSRLRGRVRQLLVDLKIGSRAQTRAAIESGRLSWNKGFGSILWEGSMLRNVGDKTWAALYEWAGRPAMPPFPIKTLP